MKTINPSMIIFNKRGIAFLKRCIKKLEKNEILNICPTYKQLLTKESYKKIMDQIREKKLPPYYSLNCIICKSLFPKITKFDCPCDKYSKRVVLKTLKRLLNKIEVTGWIGKNKLIHQNILKYDEIWFGKRGKKDDWYPEDWPPRKVKITIEEIKK